MVSIKFGSSTSRTFPTGNKEWLNVALMLFIFGCTLTDAVSAHTMFAPTSETVSIYDDQFNIPEGFGPYFIKINRCTKCLGYPYFPTPITTKLVKIVVQNSITGKVFEYTLHNHTSCKCGTKQQTRPELYKSSARVVSVAYRDQNEINNPAYIVDCSQTQQRYKRTDDNYYPPYVGYKECLPICRKDKTVIGSVTIKHRSGSTKQLQITNDISCSIPPDFVSNGNNKPGLDTMFNIDSKKTFFALVLLALVFLIITIIDLTFCCRKKGFCYSIRKCMDNEEETPQVEETFV